MSGFSVAEINNLKNFVPSIGNVVGEAGSVASNTGLTLTNNGTTYSVTAKRDGSFIGAMDGTSGSTITITGGDGTATELILP